MTEGAARRKGRPPKSEKGAATASLAMRVRPEVYDDIRRDAEANGRSISAEAERRVEHRVPDWNDVGNLVRASVEAVQQRTGKRAIDDEATRVQCRVAAEYVLEAFLGPLLSEQKLMHEIASEIDRRERARAGSRADTLTEIFEQGRPLATLEELRVKVDQLERVQAARGDAAKAIEARRPNS